MTAVDQQLKTVMLIDDDDVDQMLNRRIIQRSGLIRNIHSFQYAEDALEVLRQTQEDQIDAILLDINMPRMNGFEFLTVATQEFGSELKGIVVAMLTTSLAEKDHSTAQDFDAVKAFFHKPLTAEHVAELERICVGIKDS